MSCHGQVRWFGQVADVVAIGKEVEMVETTCPWCEAKVVTEFGRVDSEGECPECLTCWSYDEPEAELALAA